MNDTNDASAKPSAKPSANSKCRVLASVTPFVAAVVNGMNDENDVNDWILLKSLPHKASAAPSAT